MHDMVLGSLSMLMMEETASIDTLYHTTNASNALQIMKENAFRMPLAETNASETKGKKVPALYYLSTARNLNSGYISDRRSGLGVVNYPVVFVLDTKKIRNKNRGIKIISYDYWGGDKHGRNMGSGREAEERIYSNNRILNIKNSYTVLIYVDLGKYSATSWHLRQVAFYCLKNRIPVKLFTSDNLAGFRSQRENPEDRKKALETLKQQKRDHAYRTSHKGVSPYSSKTVEKFYERQGKMQDRDKRRYKEIDALRMLVEYTDYRKLPSSVKSTMLNLGWDHQSLFSKMGNYLHNLRGGNKDSDEMEKFDKLIKKMKAKTVAEFFDKLEKKWDKLREENSKREQEEWEAERRAKGLPVEPTKSVWEDTSAASFSIPFNELKLDGRSVSLALRDILSGKLSHSAAAPIAVYLGDDGFYLGDGYHRVVEAILQGKKRLKAVKDNRFVTSFAGKSFWQPDYKSKTLGFESLGFTKEQIEAAKVAAKRVG